MPWRQEPLLVSPVVGMLLLYSLFAFGIVGLVSSYIFSMVLVIVFESAVCQLSIGLKSADSILNVTWNGDPHMILTIFMVFAATFSVANSCPIKVLHILLVSCWSGQCDWDMRQHDNDVQIWTDTLLDCFTLLLAPHLADVLSFIRPSMPSVWKSMDHTKIVQKRKTSNGSWCIGIKGEMSGTVCVTFTWDIYIYMSCL